MLLLYQETQSRLCPFMWFTCPIQGGASLLGNHLDHLVMPGRKEASKNSDINAQNIIQTRVKKEGEQF